MSSHLKILIVEDEFFIALDTEEQATSLGHTVVGTAITADDAIRLAEEKRPDIILMDIRLIGERDGIAAATEIRARFGIQSIFVTTNTDASTMLRARSVDPAGILQKPLTPARLAAQLSALTKK